MILHGQDKCLFGIIHTAGLAISQAAAVIEFPHSFVPAGMPVTDFCRPGIVLGPQMSAYQKMQDPSLLFTLAIVALIQEQIAGPLCVSGPGDRGQYDQGDKYHCHGGAEIEPLRQPIERESERNRQAD